MPNFKRKGKRGRKSVRTPRRKRSKNHGSIVNNHIRYNGLSFLPRNFTTNNVWSKYLNIDSATSLLHLQYQIMNITDLDLQNADEQPLGFDQLALMYTSYIVEKCRFEVELVNASDNAVYCTLFPFPSSQSTFSAEQYLEMGITKQLLLAAKGSGKTSGKMSWTIYPHKLYDGPMSDNFVGIAGAIPAQAMMWNLRFSNAEGTAIIAVNYRVKITYTTKWFNSKPWVVS